MRKEYDFSKGKRGAVLPAPPKARITIMLDEDVIEFFRSRAKSLGVGYQTLINAALRAAMEQSCKAMKKSSASDPQIEHDANLGKLDALAAEALSDYRSDRALTVR